MNTIGKILVILNLVFAVVLFAFFGMVYAMRTNWKDAYDKLKYEVIAASGSNDASQGIVAKLNAENIKVLADLEASRQREKDIEDGFTGKLADLQAQRDGADAKAKQADLNVKSAQEESKRLKDEVQLVLATVAKREEAIAKLQEDYRKVRTAAVNLENDKNLTQERNEKLLAQVQDLSQKLARKEAGPADMGGVRNPNEPNPPQNYVKGKIETVDPKNNGLVQISVGSDHGLKKNHTLDVYRLTPSVQYLGMIRIVEADYRHAIGRFMPSSVTTRVPLREGDTVASTLEQP